MDVIHLSRWPDVPFLIPSSDQVIRRHVQATGEWEPELARFAADRIGRRPHIVIAGGHVGLSTFQLWQACPRAREISVFEPNCICAALLAVNAARWNGAPVRLWPFALGATTEFLELTSNPINSGDSRLWRPPVELAASGGDPDQWRRQPVLNLPLDAVRAGARVDLLFLDAQGWEPEILWGARETIRRWRPLIMFEWWPQALAGRGIDAHDELDLIEREFGVRLTLPKTPEVSANLHELTDSLLEDVDHTAYAQLVAVPIEG